MGVDVGTGALQVGVGKLIGKIPGVKKVLSPEAAGIGTKPVAGAVADNAAYATMEKPLKCRRPVVLVEYG